MSGRTLLVVIRGWCNTEDFFLKYLFKQPGGEIPDEFLAAITSELKNVEILCPKLEMNMFSMRSAESLVIDIYKQIEDKISQTKNIKNIVLLGYSAGSVLARRVFTLAHGVNTDATIDARIKAHWADKIERIIILSGITRGWEISSATPAYIRYFAPLLDKIIKKVGFIKKFWQKLEEPSYTRTPFIHQLIRGAPFVISTRIQYLALLNQLKEPENLVDEDHQTLRYKNIPSTVFILGSQDEFISPTDCTELGPRSEFVFFELPRSNHMDVLKIYNKNEDSKKRLEYLCKSISSPFEKLREDSGAIHPNDIDDYLDPMDINNVEEISDNRIDVEHVVMIIHGIRDDGFWTKRVAREIKKENRQSVRVVTPSYGFFSMLDFLFNRDKVTYWFLERYAEIKAYYPKANIHFIGHSNGTYLAARALEICEAIRFDNMIFAGSVVRKDFWVKLAKPKNIEGRDKKTKIINYVAEGDSVVAFFPGVLEKLPVINLKVGGAGAFGFEEVTSCQFEVKEIKYVKGGHGAAISEKFWPELAKFAISGEWPIKKDEPSVVESRNWVKRILFFFAPLLTTGAAVFIFIPLLTFVVWFPIRYLGLSYGWIDKVTFIHYLIVLMSLVVSWSVMRFFKKF